MSKDFFIYIVQFINVFASFKFFDKFFSTWSVKWVTLYIAFDLSIKNILKSCMCCIERNYHDFAVSDIRSNCLTCCFDCIDCSECFVIVLAVYYVDVVILFQHRLHDFLTFSLCKFTCLLSYKIPSVFVNAFFKTFCTSDLSCRSDCSLDISDMDIRCCDSFCFCKSVQPFSCFTTFTKSIGSDPCCVKAVIRYINHTVNDDYRDVCIFCFLKNCIPSCLCNRCKKNVINLLLDEVTDCCDLVFLFLLSIIKDQVISVFFAECVFH